MTSPIIINIGGAYGVGKSTIIDDLMQRLGDKAHKVRTLTNRPVDPVKEPNYTHASLEECKRITSTGTWMINMQLQGTLFYGTSVDEIREEGAKGHISFHTFFPSNESVGEARRIFGTQMVSIGLLPPGNTLEERLECLKQRLEGRGRETPETMAKRALIQESKMRHVQENPLIETPEGPLPCYDAVYVNDSLNQTISQIIQFCATKGIDIG